jgi:ubiquinone/menaquinone biosynthesis C-methylase UbiE
MLKDGVHVIEKKGLSYIAETGNRVRRFKPWLGDAFAWLYDMIMEHSIFPNKLAADMTKHYDILTQELKNTHEKRVLELATGSGSAIHFLGKDNQYIGTDISPALLKKAVKRFRATGFKGAAFYVTSAEQLPFEDNGFDLCLCILSLNFFNDIEAVLSETRRVLAPGGWFVCAVPVPERNKLESKIRGTLYSEHELVKMWGGHHFRFQGLPYENGSLLYFRAVLA